MKRLVVVFAFLFVGMSLTAQSYKTYDNEGKRYFNDDEGDLSIIAGVHSFINKRTLDGADQPTFSATGLYTGLAGDFAMSKDWGVQPEIMVALSFANDHTYGQIIMPVMAEYNLTEKLEIQLGPYVDYGMNTSKEENALGFGLSAGFEARATKRFKVRARFYFGLDNRLEDDPSDLESRFNYFQVGLSYDLFR